MPLLFDSRACSDQGWVYQLSTTLQGYLEAKTKFFILLEEGEFQVSCTLQGNFLSQLNNDDGEAKRGWKWEAHSISSLIIVTTFWKFPWMSLKILKLIYRSTYCIISLDDTLSLFMRQTFLFSWLKIELSTWHNHDHYILLPPKWSVWDFYDYCSNLGSVEEFH